MSSLGGSITVPGGRITQLPASSGVWICAKSSDKYNNFTVVHACRGYKTLSFTIDPQSNGLAVFPKFAPTDLLPTQEDYHEYLDAAKAVFNYCMKNNIR